MVAPFIETQAPIRHFLDLKDIPADQLRHIIDVSRSVKQDFKSGKNLHDALTGKVIAMIFEKNSTRTRISFEVAMRDFGGHAIVMSGKDMQLGRGETVEDTARVLSRYVDCVMLRTHSHADLVTFAQAGHIPVINGLTDRSHPCQIMADILTFEEHRGRIDGQTLAWVGDGNNVAHSYIEAAAKFNFTLRLACPAELQPDATILAWAQDQGADVMVTQDPHEAVSGADGVVTDCWVSMGDADADKRHAMLEPYRVDENLMRKADEHAIFMHCLPAHRGEEVTAGVIDGPQSAVWEEVENRIHAQKGVLLWAFKQI
jgi:ornithine carbamoyltransferase